MLRTLFMPALLISLSTTPLLAADGTWTGWAGAHAGWGITQTRWEDPGQGTKVDALSGDRRSVGVAAGFRYALDDWFLGADAVWSRVGTSSRFASSDGRLRFQLARSLELVATPGRQVTADTAIYLAIGRGVGRFRVDNTATGQSASDRNGAWVLGLGVERALDEDWALRGEYRRFAFDRYRWQNADGDETLTPDHDALRLLLVRHF